MEGTQSLPSGRGEGPVVGRGGRWRTSLAAATASILLAGSIGATASAARSLSCPGGAVTLGTVESATTGIGVDDDMEVWVNGVSVFRDADAHAGNVGNPHFTVQHGDQLRIMAWNSGGGHALISSLALYCDGSDERQVLERHVTEYASLPFYEIFYDKTFTVQFLTADTIAPTVTIVTPATGGVYTEGATVLADYSCADEVGGSGVASCAGTVASGSPIDTAAAGQHVFTVVATDNAGNSIIATRSYTVAYPFNGYLEPVDNDGYWNEAQAGASIPVRFSLGGDRGLGIIANGYPKSFVATCGSFDWIIDPIEEYAPAGTSGLSYDASLDQYTYVWKTKGAWANTCRSLAIQLTDGTVHWAYFKFFRLP